MSTLRSDFSLALNDVVYAKVKAYNSMGWSTYTESTSVGSATVKTEPSAPTVAVTSGASTSTSQIEVQWTALTGDATGQDPITNYEIYWDAGTNEASYVLIVNSTSSETFSATVTTGVSSGTIYKFKYRARNQFGAGSFSSVTSI